MEVRFFHFPYMKKLTKDQITDYQRFYKPGGDKGFSAQRNHEIIEGTIAKYEAELARRQKAYDETIDERADAVASFLKAIDRGKSSDPLKYFGKQELARLRGEQILGNLRSVYATKKFKSKKTAA